jgi:hypothetical protein
MAEKKRSDEDKDSDRSTKPSGAGSQIGMGGSEGLGGTYLQGPGSATGMSGASEGYENMPERGTNVGGAGAKTRRSGDRT